MARELPSSLHIIYTNKKKHSYLGRDSVVLAESPSSAAATPTATTAAGVLFVDEVDFALDSRSSFPDRFVCAVFSPFPIIPLTAAGADASARSPPPPPLPLSFLVAFRPSEPVFDAAPPSPPLELASCFSAFKLLVAWTGASSRPGGADLGDWSAGSDPLPAAAGSTQVVSSVARLW